MPPVPYLDPREGLWIPHRFRAKRLLVIRTPRSTIQHWGGLDAYYGMVREDDFVGGDEGLELQNPTLAPNGLSMKLAGEEAEVFEEIEVRGA